jgi:hypothetical protein
MPSNPNPQIYDDDGRDLNDSGGRDGHRFDFTHSASVAGTGEIVFVRYRDDDPDPSAPRVLITVGGDEYVPASNGNVAPLAEIEALAAERGISLAAAVIIFSPSEPGS